MKTTVKMLLNNLKVVQMSNFGKSFYISAFSFFYTVSNKEACQIKGFV